MKFRLRIDTELLRAVNRVVARRGITVSAFIEEVMERILKEETGKEIVTKRILQPTKKVARRRRRPLQDQE